MNISDIQLTKTMLIDVLKIKVKQGLKNWSMLRIGLLVSVTILKEEEEEEEKSQ